MGCNSGKAVSSPASTPSNAAPSHASLPSNAAPKNASTPSNAAPSQASTPIESAPSNAWTPSKVDTLEPISELTNSIVREETVNNFNARSRYSHRPVEQDFEIEDAHVLGEGLNGVVRKGRNRFTMEECAVKVLLKKGLAAEKVDTLHNEVNNYLNIDHPHIARLLHVYEDEDRVCLVMELCEGRELFDRLMAKTNKQFSEREAMEAAYQMLLAIAYLHRRNIVHCDLKLENLLYESDETANLKLIDFGFSKIFNAGGKVSRPQGTESYMAPEVFQGVYTDKCDMWSIGVIVFLLLGGHPPFPMNDDDAAERAILKGEYKFKEEAWKDVSQHAQDFVRRLLQVNPNERMSAFECLEHPWLAHMDMERRSEASLDSGSAVSPDELVGDLVRYKQHPSLKRAVLTLMAHRLTWKRSGQFRESFLALDTDRSGTITRENFRDALVGTDLSEADKWSLFDCIDVANDGEIRYSEFIAATMLTKIQIEESLINEAFKLFDVSRTGYITQSDLKLVLGSNGFEEADIKTLISECYGCHPNQGIDFHRFDQLLRGETSFCVSTDGKLPRSPSKKSVTDTSETCSTCASSGPSRTVSSCVSESSRDKVCKI